MTYTRRMIMTIKIVTDSTAYIPEDLLAKYDISVISLNVIMNGESLRELDINDQDFYSTLPLLDEIPTSSQPILHEMMTTFETLIKEGHQVLGIFLSSEMSGTFSSAHMVRNMILENHPDASIELLDSKTNCMQMGFIALEAAKAAKNGANLREVLDIATTIKYHSRFLFTPETLDYLKKGGRIGGASALLGNIFQIKPILTVEDGKTTVFTKVRTKKKAIQSFITKLAEDLEGHQLGDIIVHHIHCEQEGLALAKQLEEEFKLPVRIQAIGPVIGSHVGPGSIGIAYYIK